MLPLAPDTLLQQRYRILNLLGEGEFGRTYRAADRGRAEAICAIEEIVPSAKFPSTVAKAKESFKQEATRLYQLQHLQIPRFWATFEDQNRLFLVRDEIEGKTYRDLIEQRRDLGTVFSEAEVWQFLIQILPAIGYIHGKGVIHKSISPAHIIYRDSDRLPVLTDFGVIKEVAHKLQANPVSPHIAIGEPGYAPVEQINSGQVYPHSDLYAIAVTAMVLLTGKEPSALFSGGSIDWEWRKWTQIGDEFANILGRMVSPYPNDRYQSASEVERDLQALQLATSRSTASKRTPLSAATNNPTVAVGGKNTFSSSNRIQTAITNLNVKSVWEKPQVYIPLALLVAILTGVGSWFGVSQFRHNRSSEPVASTPPKQIDFNNPTIPTDSSSPSPTTGDTLQPDIDRPILKEGTVDPNTPVRFKMAALAGQNLDIQLVPAIGSTDPTRSNPTGSNPSPISPINLNPNQQKDPKSNNPPISVPSPSATQVLMTIISPTGTPIDTQADRVVGWRGTVPISGDYTIELRPIKGLPGKLFPYKLNITQLSVIPSPSPLNTPDPATPSIGAPLPIDNGIRGLPPTTNPPINDNTPSVAPAPIPTIVPSPIERPARNRRRNRAETEPSPQIRERVKSSEESTPTPRRRRTRVESSEESTPTPRRRRTRVESSEETTPTPRRRRERVESSEESTPTPRRRRNRQNNSETQPQPSPEPKVNVDDNEPNNTPEPQIGIPVPPAKNPEPEPNKTDGDATNPSPSTTTDPD